MSGALHNFSFVKTIFRVAILCSVLVVVYYLFKASLIHYFLLNNKISFAKLVDPNDSQIWNYYYQTAVEELDYQNLSQLLSIAPKYAPDEAFVLIDHVKSLEKSSYHIVPEMQKQDVVGSESVDEVLPESCFGNLNSLKCYLIFRKSGLTDAAVRTGKYLEEVYPEIDLFEYNINQTKTNLRQALLNLSE